MSHSKQNSSREEKKPKGAQRKSKPQTEYQRTRDEEKARKHKRGTAFFD